MHSNSLDGKVALISGAAGGVGSAIAARLVSEGARVIVSDVDDAAGSALIATLGSAARFAHLDVTNEEQWIAAVALAIDEHGGLDILVNNAGIYRYSLLEDTALTDYLTLVQINQVGTFLGMKTAVSALKSSTSGSIINISSVAGMRGGMGKSGYASSKWAVRGLTKVAASELGVHGVRVNAILPGGIDTPMLDDVPGGDEFRRHPATSTPIGRIGLPDDVAGLVRWLASDEAGYVTGSEFVIDGGTTAA